MNYKNELDNSIRAVYVAAYKAAGLNVSETARLLGVARGTVIRKLADWGITKKSIFGTRILLSEKNR